MKKKNQNLSSENLTNSEQINQEKNLEIEQDKNLEQSQIAETPAPIPDDLIPPEPLVKKRGRKSKEEKELEEKTKQIQKISKDALKNICSIPFDILAMRFGEHWKLKAFELEQLSTASEMLLDKYSPALAQYSIEFFFGLTLFSIFTPRILIEINKLRGEKGNENTSADYISFGEKGIGKNNTN